MDVPGSAWSPKSSIITLAANLPQFPPTSNSDLQKGSSFIHSTQLYLPLCYLGAAKAKKEVLTQGKKEDVEFIRRLLCAKSFTVSSDPHSPDPQGLCNAKAWFFLAAAACRKHSWQPYCEPVPLLSAGNTAKSKTGQALSSQD